MASIHILADGYSRILEGKMEANCSCVLVKGEDNIIVDTMTAWDGHYILQALRKCNLTTDDINWVVCTHGHSDHTGNNNLFLKAKHIVGFSLNQKNVFLETELLKGNEFVINKHVRVLPTPGHTLTDVSVLVTTPDKNIVAISGDLFEKEEDINDPSIWREIAGSEAPELQIINRSKIAEIASFIIPGHGPYFKVTDEMRSKLKEQLTPPCEQCSTSPDVKLPEKSAGEYPQKDIETIAV
ncbi:metallo-beta-lactamase domain-containing protein 1 [Chrysoperla carnea]|uniref:metallo-beta-lactamase domain-containing protein 1 n=1 Tax=Chrysoperla carnea TaxID=189513 RepID=UPI001D07F3EF|nr:metallo-beta-lactamase domain-containing protein 1 [Chrysoperla carnea]